MSSTWTVWCETDETEGPILHAGWQVGRVHFYDDDMPKAIGFFTEHEFCDLRLLTAGVLVRCQRARDDELRRLEDAVRGFLLEKHLPVDQLDAWADELVAIVNAVAGSATPGGDHHD